MAATAREAARCSATLSRRPGGGRDRHGIVSAGARGPAAPSGDPAMGVSGGKSRKRRPWFALGLDRSLWLQHRSVCYLLGFLEDGFFLRLNENLVLLKTIHGNNFASSQVGLWSVNSNTVRLHYDCSSMLEVYVPSLDSSSSYNAECHPKLHTKHQSASSTTFFHGNHSGHMLVDMDYL
jgi:hypothetical protein